MKEYPPFLPIPEEDNLDAVPVFELQASDKYEHYNDIASSLDGVFAVATGNGCDLIINPITETVAKTNCNETSLSVSYCCGMFGFITNEGKVYFVTKDGKTINEINLEEKTDALVFDHISMESDGFIVCQFDCAFFDYAGNLKWVIELDGEMKDKPGYFEEYWYGFLNYNKVVVITDGSVVNEIDMPDIYSLRTCGKYMLTMHRNTYTLFDLEENPLNPTKIWEYFSLEANPPIAFSTSCDYVAMVVKLDSVVVTDHFASKFYKKTTDIGMINNIEWSGPFLAVMDSRKIKIYKIPKIIKPFYCFD